MAPRRIKCLNFFRRSSSSVFDVHLAFNYNNGTIKSRSVCQTLTSRNLFSGCLLTYFPARAHKLFTVVESKYLQNQFANQIICSLFDLFGFINLVLFERFFGIPCSFRKYQKVFSRPKLQQNLHLSTNQRRWKFDPLNRSPRVADFC